MKNISKKILEGICLTTLALSTSNCAPVAVGTSPAVYEGAKYAGEEWNRDFPEGQIHEYNVEELNQERVRYKLQSFSAYGNEFYAEDINPTSNEELPIAIYFANDVKREINLEDESIQLTPNTIYVPIKTKLPNGNNAKSITLETSGKYGKRAIKNNYDANNKSLSTRVTRESDFVFSIETITIPMKDTMEEYFAIKVESNKECNNDYLNFYLIPTKNAKLEIEESTGKITILNDGNIYRAKKSDVKIIEENRNKNGNPTRAIGIN